MNKLPPSAASLLAQARAEDRAHRVDVERSLAALSASLPFADAAPQGALEPGALQSGVEGALGAGKGASVVLASKSIKLVLATVALGGALGGGAWLGMTPSPRAATAPRGAKQAVAAAAEVARSAPAAEVARSAPAVQASRREIRAAKPSQELPGGDRTAVRMKRPSAQQAPRVIASQPARTAASAEALAPVQSTAPAPDKEREEATPGALASATELDLIDGALTSLRASAAQAALTQLEQHQRLYAQGKFAVERRGLRVLALCQLGQKEQAQRERATFLASYPSAPIAARVRQACRSEGER